MEQFLIIYRDDVYMLNAKTYDEALDSLSIELNVHRDFLFLECSDLEYWRRVMDNAPGCLSLTSE